MLFKNRFHLFALLSTTAVTISILIILFFFTWTKFAKNTLIDNVVFTNTSSAWPRFKSTADIKNLRLSFNIFNVTNTNEFLISGGLEKLAVQEVGPFVYDIERVKDIINHNTTDGTISYKLKTIYKFNRQLSIADARLTNVTWPNVPLLVSIDYIEKLNFFMRRAAYLLFNGEIQKHAEPFFITDTVDNLVISGSYRSLFGHMKNILPYLKPWPLVDNKFALFYGKNDTFDPSPTFTVSDGFLGNQTYQELNQLRLLNNKTRLPYWDNNTKQCNIVNGTDGQFFSPLLNSSQDLTIYVPDLCRRVQLGFRKAIYIHGINSLAFAFDKRNFLSYKNAPENECYCLERDKNTGEPLKECSYDGLIDLSSCNQPNILASLAHFYGGSPELTERLRGVSLPDAQIDLPRLMIEPYSGNTLRVYTPTQINVRLRSDSKLSILQFYKPNEPLIIPLAIILQSSSVTEEQASMLKGLLMLLDTWLITAVLGGAIILIGIIVTAVIYLYCNYKEAAIRRRTNVREAQETDPLIPDATQ